MEALINHAVIRFSGDHGKTGKTPSPSSSSSSSSSFSRRIPMTSASSRLPRRLLRGPKVEKLCFEYSPSLDRKLKLSPLNSAPSSSNSFTPATMLYLKVEDAFTGSQLETTEPPKTVHVRFVLQKECLFGQQFVLVGDDPILGLWDPSSPIPLEWSDGHVWMAELDLPIKEEIRFKFILKSASGEIEWQPGPDRVIQPFETSGTIVVTEDWENTENQMITEIELLGVLDKEIKAESMTGSNGHALIAETQHAEALEIHVSMVDGNSTQEEHHDNITKNMVLVPGLVPIPASNASTSKAESIPLISAGFTEAHKCDSVQLPGKEEKPDGWGEDQLGLGEEITELSQPEPAEYAYEETPQNIDIIARRDLQSKEHSDLASSDILGSDMQWGRKVWEKLLFNLGFSPNPAETKSPTS